MNDIYLVRHGQAGTRDAYDSLSDLGRRQSRLLGEHFLSEGICFAAVFAGTLRRQQQTAEEVGRAFADAGISFPAPQIDPGWDEFDLGLVYREIAPRLSADDPQFRRDYEEMCEQVEASAGAHQAKVHRKWQPCDTKIVVTWIRGSYPYSGETWGRFLERVLACRLRMPEAERHQSVLVVTSGVPVGIWAGASLDIGDERIMRLAAVLFNASYTLLRLDGPQPRLFTFNATPHLAAGLLSRR